MQAQVDEYVGYIFLSSFEFRRLRGFLRQLLIKCWRRDWNMAISAADGTTHYWG